VEVAIGRGVNFHDKCWEEDMHAKAVHTDEASSPLPLMRPKAVKGIA
jgi:hypothetical protein